MSPISLHCIALVVFVAITLPYRGGQRANGDRGNLCNHLGTQSLLHPSLCNQGIWNQADQKLMHPNLLCITKTLSFSSAGFSILITWNPQVTSPQSQWECVSAAFWVGIRWIRGIRWMGGVKAIPPNPIVSVNGTLTCRAANSSLNNDQGCLCEESTWIAWSHICSRPYKHHWNELTATWNRQSWHPNTPYPYLHNICHFDWSLSKPDSTNWFILHSLQLIDDDKLRYYRFSKTGIGHFKFIQLTFTDSSTSP